MSVECLIEDKLVLEDAALSIVELAIAVLVRHDEHLSALEVEKHEVGDQVGKAWLHLRRIDLILIKWLETVVLGVTFDF